MNSSLNSYVQPVASHVSHPERLLVRTQDDAFYLWPGTGDPMIEIPTALAAWMISRPEIFTLCSPRHWFDIECLPIAVEMYDYDSEWSVAD